MNANKKITAKSSKGLQKLTESENTIEALLALKKITFKDLARLTEEQQREFFDILIHKLNTLKGDDLAKFISQTEDVLLPRIKNDIWGKNHTNIMRGISSFINDNGRMPTKMEIAHTTGLSRQTIDKHLKEYKASPYYAEFQEQFSFMYHKLMASIFHFAIAGDMKAAKLYLDSIGALQKASASSKHCGNTLIQNQNNFIQIGGTILHQELIQNLNPEQISAIENIVKTIDVKKED